MAQQSVTAKKVEAKILTVTESLKIFLDQKSTYCFCNEDLCNSGNWDRELPYLLMGITIGFQIVINCLVVWKYKAMSKAWF